MPERTSVGPPSPTMFTSSTPTPVLRILSSRCSVAVSPSSASASSPAKGSSGGRSLASVTRRFYPRTPATSHWRPREADGQHGRMARILVTEQLAEAGLDALRQAGHDVDVRLGLSPEELLEVVPGAAALIIRSATQVTEDVLAAGTDLVVVGRAGIGLDNVDVAAATRQGVMVVNAPQSNILSA